MHRAFQISAISCAFILSAGIHVGAFFGDEDPGPSVTNANASLAGEDPIVRLDTSRGPISIRVFKSLVPVTSNNFLDLVNRGFYAGKTFHRIENWCIQGGSSNGDGAGAFVDPKTGRPRLIPLEINRELRHSAPGVVAMARMSNINSASCQFYIMKCPLNQLDDKYAIFGKVVGGMQTVYAMRPGDGILSTRVISDNNSKSIGQPSKNAEFQKSLSSSATKQAQEIPASTPSNADNGTMESKVDLFEKEIFGKTYNDPLPERVSRIEAVLFPGKSITGETLNKRITNLESVVPVTNKIAQSSPVDAIDTVRKAPKAQVVDLNNEGVKALNAGDFQLAIEKLTQSLKLDPDYDLAKENLAIAYNNYGLQLQNSPKDAIKMFWKALALSPSNQTTITNVDGIIRLLGKDPKNFDHRINFGDEARKSGDFDSAILEYQAALKLKDDGATHEKLGDCYRVQDKLDAAIKEFRLAVQTKDSASLRVKLGQVLHSKEALAESITEYKQALALNPHERDTLEALHAAWASIVAKNPTAPENHIGLGQALQLMGDFDQAEQEYKSAITFSSEKQNSIAQKLLDELPAAKKVFEVQRRIEAGVDRQSKKLYDQALEEYKQAQQLDSNNPTIEANIGTVWQAKGDLVRAKEFYNKALALQPNNPVALSGIKSCNELEAKKTKVPEKMPAHPAGASTVEDVYAKVSKIETQLLKQSYSSDDILTRLERLDQKAFGHVQSGSVSERIQRLQKKTQPVSTSFSSDQKLEQVHKALAQMETKAFSRTFQSDDVLTRVSRLEQKLLGKEQQGTLMKRIDGLLILH